MKLTDWIIIFVIFTIPFTMVQDIQNQQLDFILAKKIEMDRILDTALDDGASVLVENVVNTGTLDKERAVQVFFDTLCRNLNVQGNAYERARLMTYVPCIILLDKDGVMVWHQETVVGGDGYQRIEPVWEKKKNFVLTREDYIYQFSLDEYVVVYDRNNNTFQEGFRQDIAGDYPGTWLTDPVVFDQVRRRCIIETIQDELNYYINAHNTLARSLGVTYEFYLPTIEESPFANTVDDIGMIAFFQGMPMGVEGIYYINYAFGAAQQIKSDWFYIQEDLNHILYYHRENCPLLIDTSVGHTSREKCAREGAFPCGYCKP